MSSNRLKYDDCSYRTDLSQSVGPLEYILNPSKYENCQKCRHEFGLLGGTAVSHIKGNLIDLENDLRGATRSASSCPDNKHKPGKKVLHFPGNACNKPRTVNLEKLHLQPCQMIRYPPTALPPAPQYNNCPAPLIKTTPPCYRR